MAHTARSKKETKEFFDTPEELNKKVKILAFLIKKRKHFIAFTGAGISTSCGIPDFRSGINTVLDTGAGVWTVEDAQNKGISVHPPKKCINDMIQAIPSVGHMALVKLAEVGYLKFLISQNFDGIHRRSGFPIEKLAELHGNTNLEVCQKCGKQYSRDFDVSGTGDDHITGRICVVPNCGGNLIDTIINFGEWLPSVPLEQSESNAEKADLCLCLGSSLTVRPAADLAEIVGKKGTQDKNSANHLSEIKHTLCIVNLQKTELDDDCQLRIFAKIDDVMIRLMEELKLDIPQWNLVRYIQINIEEDLNNEDTRHIKIDGIDKDGTQMTLFKKISLKYKKKMKKKHKDTEVVEPLSFTVKRWSNVEKEKIEDITFNLVFMGHYDEPDLTIKLNDFLTNDSSSKNIIKIILDTKVGKWIVPSLNEQLKDSIIRKLLNLDDLQENQNEEDELKHDD